MLQDKQNRFITDTRFTKQFYYNDFKQKSELDEFRIIIVVELERQIRM